MTQEVEQMMASNNWQGALAKCKELGVQYPTSAKVMAYTGLCFYKAQDFGNAATYFKKALLLDEKYFDAALKLAQCLDRLLLYSEALEAAQVAHKLRPSDPTANVLLNGLQRQVASEPAQAWNKGVRHNVTISSD